MSVEKCSNDILKEKANNARDTKECIIYMAESYEKIDKKLEEIARNAKEQISKKPIKDFHFDKSFDKSIQPIVIRNKKAQEEQERN